jgi:anthranilate phosphoribosyltransferase
VVAGAGVPVAKHGNRAITSQCGSADLLAELGVNIEASLNSVEDCMREVGLGFLFAPKLHPAMKYAMGPRREVGVRTIFNMLGPLTNPAGAKGQLLGVFSSELTEPFAQVLRLLGSRRAFVVHGHDGMDEMTTTALTRVSELDGGRVTTYDFDPREFVETFADLRSLRGGDPTTNAAITRSILAGVKGPARDIVCLNASAAIVAGGLARNIRQGWDLAHEAIDNGRAQEVLDGMVRITTAV